MFLNSRIFSKIVLVKLFLFLDRVAVKDDMLVMPIFELQRRYNKTYRAHDICICDKTDPNEQGIHEEITCTNAIESGDACGRDSDITPVQKGTCYERHNRKKRSARHHITYLPDNFVTNDVVERAKVNLDNNGMLCLFLHFFSHATFCKRTGRFIFLA